MAMQTFKLFMHITTTGALKGTIDLVPFDMTRLSHYKDKALLRELTIEADVPEFDLATMELVGLEKELQLERADSQVRQNILLDLISKLKAIGHEVIEG